MSLNFAKFIIVVKNSSESRDNRIEVPCTSLKGYSNNTERKEEQQ